MEPKYVTLKEVVDEVLSDNTGSRMSTAEMIRMYDQTGYLYFHSAPQSFVFPYETADPIITEDVDCEVIEPKQLPFAAL